MLTRRYELKFPMAVEAIAPFMLAARGSLEADVHGRGTAYRVSSQYFDTPDFSAYREKQDGENVRRKLRLRYYAIDPSGAPRVREVFMEIKRRIGNTVFKERLALTDEGAEAILQDARQLRHIEQHIAPQDLKLRSTIDAIVLAAAREDLRAALVITYLREAWEGSKDARLRVTFDTRCQAYAPGAYLDVASGKGAPILPPNICLMEVKFDSAIPRWVRDVIAMRGLELRRFSKYAAGVEALRLREASSDR